MQSGDTIVAIASPVGRSARGLIRLSGPACRSVCEDCMSTEWKGRSAGSCRFRIATDVSAPCLWIAYTAPRTYTGEDIVELILPGNPHLLDRVMATLTALPGVRRAAPGEFTARAYLNSKLTLEQAEGVAMTIAATNDAELAAAHRYLTGVAGRVCAEIADAVAQTLALVEAGIDFSDQEDVVLISTSELLERIATALSDLDEMLTGAVGEHREGNARVVLVGPPNAGKSTLFNALLGIRRSVVSDESGTTRDAIVEQLDLSQSTPSAGTVDLVDLAGLDDSSVGALDSLAQQRALDEIDRADVLVVCDPTGRFDVPMCTRTGSEKPTLRIRTKADLPGEHNNDSSIAVCALDGWNLAALVRAIADSCSASTPGDRLVAPRHAQAMQHASQSLHRAHTRARDQPIDLPLQEVELIALELRQALDALGSITGAVTPDDVIGRVFASFCVGK
jgi:tRNA modification GTPase